MCVLYHYLFIIVLIGCLVRNCLVRIQGGIIDENEEAVTRKLNAIIQHIARQSTILNTLLCRLINRLI